MQWFRDWKTANKLVSGFALTAVLIGIVGWFGVRGLGTLNDMLGTLYQRDTVGLSAIKEANINLIYISRAMRAALLASDKAEVQTHRQRVAKYRSDLMANLDRTEKTVITDEGKQKIAQIRAALPEYFRIVDESMRLAEEQKDQAALEVVTRGRAIADQLDESMSGVAESKEKLGLQAFEKSGEVYAETRNTMIGVIVLASLLAIGFGWGVARMIAQPLQQTVEVLNGVAAGDLTRALAVTTKDEVGAMAAALNEAVAAMRKAMIEVRGSAGTVSSAAQQLAAASEELSSGAQEQASSQEETSATLEEIGATVKQNAENAKQANQLALQSRESAEKGGDVVGAAIAAMNEINSASKKIAEIITTIDEIAFQTNLLALNAAVEAARAGEQGRGFAVVASEVRSLAQRSATAAKETKVLIQDSVRKVEAGSDLVNRSGATLNEIVASVKRVTDMVAEITAASDQQAVGIEQVTKAMTQMDQVTQQNSAQTEELSSTAQSLSSNSEQLQALVARFQVGNDVHPVHASNGGAPPFVPKKRVLAAPSKRAHAPSGSLAELARELSGRPARETAEVAAGFHEY